MLLPKGKEHNTMKKTRRFRIKDIDCESIVEIARTQHEVFSWLDEYLENLEYHWFDPDDDTYEILYKDGTQEYIDRDYDGHKIRRNNIDSIVYNNACSAIVFGGFSINEFGVVTASKDIEIADSNIEEIF